MAYFEKKQMSSDLQKFMKNFAGEAFVLDIRMDTKVQMKYFSMASAMRGKYTDRHLAAIKRRLNNPKLDLEIIRELVVRVASIGSVKGLNVLEAFLPHAPEVLTDWVKMAILENKFILHSSLSDVAPILIATGLGGKGTRLRYFLAFFSKNEQGFEDWQQNLLRGELAFALEERGELERMDFWKNFVAIDLLLDFQIDVKLWVRQIMEVCNEMGGFIAEDHIITNIRTFSESQLKAYRKKNISALQSPAVRP